MLLFPWLFSRASLPLRDGSGRHSHSVDAGEKLQDYYKANIGEEQRQQVKGVRSRKEQYRMDRRLPNVYLLTVAEEEIPEGSRAQSPDYDEKSSPHGGQQGSAGEHGHCNRGRGQSVIGAGRTA